MEDNSGYKKYFTKEDDDEIWRNTFKKTRAIDRRKKVRKIGAIACIAFITVCSLLFLRPATYYAGNRNLKIVLSDRSEITLFKGSSLTVDNFLFKKNRNVYLRGNGIFNVSKSKEKPFIVHGNGYETKVLGTVFKVTQINKTFSVDLYEGKVLVYRPETPNDIFELKPKQTFSNMGSLKVATVKPSDTEKAILPKITFSVNDIPFSEAAKIIENTYNIKLKYPMDIEKSIISLSTTSANAHDLIQMISLKLNLNIKQINDKTFELEE